MILYHTVRIAEILVIVWVGFLLITRTYEMRWNRMVSKIAIGIVLSLLTALMAGNSFWFRYSGIEYVMGGTVIFLLVLIFYRIPALCAGVYSLLLWANLDVFHFIILIIVSNATKAGNVHNFNADVTAGHPAEAIRSICVIGIVLTLYRKREGQSFIHLNRRKGYIAILVLVIIEFITMCLVFSQNMLEVASDERNVQVAVFFLIAIICVGVLCIIYNSYTEEKQQIQLLRVKNSMVEQQFDDFRENYELKRRQVHDTVQQNLLLQGYLREGKVEEACRYLDEIQSEIKRCGIKGETGISAIDIILHYKRRRAEKERIEIKTNIEVYFCPLERNDLGVLLGNLLDNAIEAATELLDSQRIIKLEMKTINHIFLLEVENEYIGQRKLCEGKYITTKRDKDAHGLGLESCRRIVEGYGGDFRILDDGNTFKVEITIFKEAEK